MKFISAWPKINILIYREKKRITFLWFSNNKRTISPYFLFFETVSVNLFFWKLKHHKQLYSSETKIQKHSHTLLSLLVFPRLNRSNNKCYPNCHFNSTDPFSCMNLQASLSHFYFLPSEVLHKPKINSVPILASYDTMPVAAMEKNLMRQTSTLYLEPAIHYLQRINLM